MAMRRTRAITDDANKHSLTRSAVSAYPLHGRARQGKTPMELIQLTPHSDVDPSQPLRAPGDILLHAYLIPNALNPARLAPNPVCERTNCRKNSARSLSAAADLSVMEKNQMPTKAMAIENSAKLLFGADYANVQPHSGSSANSAVYLALLQAGDTQYFCFGHCCLQS